MKGYPTSYAGMFRQRADNDVNVAGIEIPLFQRDYAQGRRNPRVDDIRSTFLEALHQALTDGKAIGLDFVYGEVNDGTFEPLDGQQRLTTLFLLHWYLAFRSGRLGDTQPWTGFTYATRPSARLFCERIVENPPPADLSGSPSPWVKDQSWYLHLWRLFDPTIEAMLVMLDAIAARFLNDDLDVAWERLTDEADPAVWFQLLPIDEMGSAEDLYIKMNSRGRPLTEFEEFKALLGQTIAHTGRAEEFGRKIDGAWADLLWEYRGDNDIVDDEFMNYFDFVFEICEWREGRIRDDPPLRPERRAKTLFGDDNPRYREHLAFFFDALDVWANAPDVQAIFEAFFTRSASTPGIHLFGASTVNLFRSCCERYGATRGSTRVFSLTDTLLLYATLVHRIQGTEDALRRLRRLRNLNEASQFELRVQNMPKLIAEVEEFMRSGSLDALATFNENQVADERSKQAFLAEHPELEPAVERLEDQPILRGTLASFDLDAATVESRAAAFEAAFAPEHWPVLTGALLAIGEYQHDIARWDYHLFGSPARESVWREVLVARGDRTSLARTRAVLASFLDTPAASPGPIRAQLAAIVDKFVADRVASAELDWRYYLVRYTCMREGDSGIYYGADHALGYQLTMLRKTRQSSWYRDPYLYAIWREIGSPEDSDPWFSGYSTDERWMRLEPSQTGIRSVPIGIAVQAPAAEQHRTTFESICRRHTDVVETEAGWLLAVAQQERNGGVVDTEDRVQKAASFLRELVAVGL